MESGSNPELYPQLYISKTFLSRSIASVTVMHTWWEGDKKRNESEYIVQNLDFQYFREKKPLKPNPQAHAHAPASSRINLSFVFKKGFVLKSYSKIF
jgi:hypothetical protein